MHNFQMNIINNYLPLRDVVFYTLRQAILKGELKPGERLMEMQLANQLGVSRTPIREAIRKLELEGLVLMIPRRGAVVAKITEKDLRDVLEVRTSLEKLAIELACQRMPDETIPDLRQALEAFKEALKKEDLTAQAEKDEQFHDVIFKSTGNQREQMYRYRLEYLKDSSAHERLVEEHEAIIQALSVKDKEKAADIIARHIYNQELSVIRKIQEDDKKEESK